MVSGRLKVGTTGLDEERPETNAFTSEAARMKHNITHKRQDDMYIPQQCGTHKYLVALRHLSRVQSEAKTKTGLHQTQVVNIMTR